MQVYSIVELAAAIFQTVVTVGLAALCHRLYRRHHKDHFLWWAMALGAYSLSLVALVTFLSSGIWSFLYAHQVMTGWTALGFLYAALVFSRQVRWHRWFLGFLVFPVVWSYVTIFLLDDFGVAAGAAVVFLSITTMWAGVVFWRYRKLTGSLAAGWLAVTLALWAIHHLDYPILRARGAWSPWGYYLDTLFVLAMGAGILLLVIEELREGLGTLMALSGDLRQRDRGDSRAALLERPLGLRGVRGAALLRTGPTGLELIRGVGAASEWAERIPPPIERLVGEVAAVGGLRLDGEPRPSETAPAFTAVLPLGRSGADTTVLVIVGDVAASFSALDDRILAAVGAQIGSALDNADLYHKLERRTEELERLSVRMLGEHEEQRRRLGRELHDETAQVFSALKLQLGSLREMVPAEVAPRFDRLVELVDTGTRSIRSVTDALRPAVLENLGLIPAIRAVIGDFQEWSGIQVELDAAPGAGDDLSPAAELALFRAAQEALSNVARHAQAERVAVRVGRAEGQVRLRVADRGIGLSPDEVAGLDGGPGRSGLFGMRERIVALGGRVAIRSVPGEGLELEVTVPAGGAE